MDQQPARRRWLLLPAAAVVLLVLVVIVGFRLFRPKPAAAPLIPASISKQVSFVIYYPPADWQTPPSATSYSGGIVNIRSTQGATQLAITEQATPEVFIDVAQYYPNLITKLNQYASLGTVNGTAYLTKPKELGGQQQAVLNNNGTLLFAHPTKNLSTDDWRRFFNNLRLIKPN